jgi:acyl-CoA synthetase (AMP-forming)/AMP-acid ligase II
MLCDLGHIPVPTPPDLSELRRGHILRQNPHAWLLHELELTKPSCEEVVLYNSCYGSLTSGSTSVPKLAFLSLVGGMENAKAHAASLNIDAHTTILQSLPVYHSFGVVAYLLTPLVTGANIDFNSTPLFLNQLAKRSLHNVILHTSPAQARFMKRENITVAGLTSISIGAGTLCRDDLLALRKKLPNTNFYITYGLTEAGPRVTTALVDDSYETGDIGIALQGVGLSVLQADGQEVASGTGVLCLKSPSLKLNLENSELTADHRSLITRDIVHLSPLGHVRFLGRDVDMIKVGGVTVYPKDVEEITRRFDKISDCIVLKKECALYEEVPIMFVEGECDVDKLRSWLIQVLSPQEFPREINMIDKLPRNSFGKIDRSLLRSLNDQKIRVGVRKW